MDMRNAYRILVGKPEGKRLLGRPRPSWEDNIKMDHREIMLECVDWIHVAQDRDRWWAPVNTVVNLQVPRQAGVSLLPERIISFSTRTLLHGVSYTVKQFYI
jgi:hypothetical protein